MGGCSHIRDCRKLEKRRGKKTSDITKKKYCLDLIWLAPKAGLDSAKWTVIILKNLDDSIPRQGSLYSKHVLAWYHQSVLGWASSRVTGPDLNPSPKFSDIKYGRLCSSNIYDQSERPSTSITRTHYLLYHPCTLWPSCWHLQHVAVDPCQIFAQSRCSTSGSDLGQRPEHTAYQDKKLNGLAIQISAWDRGLTASQSALYRSLGVIGTQWSRPAVWNS